MAVALPDGHQVVFFTSPDLKHWTKLSTFGASSTPPECRLTCTPGSRYIPPRRAVILRKGFTQDPRPAPRLDHRQLLRLPSKTTTSSLDGQPTGNSPATCASDSAPSTPAGLFLASACRVRLLRPLPPPCDGKASASKPSSSKTSPAPSTTTSKSARSHRKPTVDRTRAGGLPSIFGPLSPASTAPASDVGPPEPPSSPELPPPSTPGSRLICIVIAQLHRGGAGRHHDQPAPPSCRNGIHPTRLDRHRSRASPATAQVHLARNPQAARHLLHGNFGVKP